MATACGAAAGLFLVAMMLLTVADVVLRAVSNRPIRGTFEIIELLLACTFFLALPAVFLRDEHLLVDVIDPLAPRWVPWLRRFAEIIAIPVLAAMAWEGWKAAAVPIATRAEKCANHWKYEKTRSRSTRSQAPYTSGARASPSRTRSSRNS